MKVPLILFLLCLVAPSAFSENPPEYTVVYEGDYKEGSFAKSPLPKKGKAMYLVDFDRKRFARVLYGTKDGIKVYRGLSPRDMNSGEFLNPHGKPVNFLSHATGELFAGGFFDQASVLTGKISEVPAYTYNSTERRFEVVRIRAPELLLGQRNDVSKLNAGTELEISKTTLLLRALRGVLITRVTPTVPDPTRTNLETVDETFVAVVDKLEALGYVPVQ